MKINKIELKAKRAKRFYGWHLLPPSFLPATTYSRKGRAAGGRGRSGRRDGRRERCLVDSRSEICFNSSCLTAFYLFIYICYIPLYRCR